MTSRLALAAALTLALAACGSDNASDEAAEETSDAEVAAEATVESVVAETPAPDGEATPAAEKTASPTPSPTPTATATATTVATATAAAGSPPDSFKQCAICHKVTPGEHGLGPSLANVFGARAGHASGFNYSPAMEAADLAWNQANLDRYLANPQAVVPGTTMAFAGVKEAAKRAEIIAYLKNL